MILSEGSFYFTLKIFVRDKSFYTAVCTIAIPIVLQSLITTGVNLADTMMLTAYGELQLSASSLANQFISLFQIICLGLGFGASVLTSRYWGSGDPNSIKKVTTLMIRICLAFAVVFNIVTFLFPWQIMTIYTPDDPIIQEGALYLRICAFTFLLHGLSQTITAVLRSVRQVQIPLYTAVVAFFVNIFFNWIFIFGKLGAPEMGVEGAALGTLIARFVEFTIIVGYFLFVDNKIGYRIKDIFCSCKGYMSDYIRYSIPVLVSDTLLGLGNNMVSIIMGHISPNFIAAFAIVSQVTRMTTVLTQGVSNAASVMTGNTLGEGDKQKAYNQGITFLALALCVGAVASVVIYAICPHIISASNLSSETREIAIQLVHSVNITILFSAAQSVLTKGILRGAGDTRFLMVADILFLWLASVPLGYLTGIVWGCNAFIVYLALHTDWIIKSIWCTVRLLKGKWVNNAVQKR